MKPSAVYDAVIAGAGHNGLVAACYLSMAGLRVLVLEKNPQIGGATFSQQVFPGVDARLSVYSYLVSLLPEKIIADLGLRFQTRQRAVASYNPVERQGRPHGLLISNESEADTRASFLAFTGSEREYRGYLRLQERLELFARHVWPTLLAPLPSRAELQRRFEGQEGRAAWDYLIEKPLSALIEDHLTDDVVRGAVFTNAKIGVLTDPDDPTMLQNRTYLYHVIGQGTGTWRVPVGGMGALVAALAEKAQQHGAVIQTGCEVIGVDPGAVCEVRYRQAEDGEARAAARWVLFNTSSDVANRCLPGAYAEEQVEGAVFKMNMVLKRLPTMRDRRVSARDAFTGTLHLAESYEQMRASYRRALGDFAWHDAPMPSLPSEMYCHSLTDPSILSPELQAQGYQTLTLFGMDVPYRWFSSDHARVKAAVTRRYLDEINRVIQDDIVDCLAEDADGALCLDAKSPLDLEGSLGLPRGNIFHGNLSWPFAEREEEIGAWGVETAYPNVLICGSSARRGGAVSGIPGHNAAMKVLGRQG